MLIDYEYGMWNPAYIDIAMYLNEFILDNAYPYGVGIKYYFSNWATDKEIEHMTKQYFMLNKQRELGADCNFEWSLENSECQKAVQEVKQCMVLNNFWCALWAIMVLSDAEETDPTIFHWEFFHGRCLAH